MLEINQGYTAMHGQPTINIYYLGLCKYTMTFAPRRNRLTSHFSEGIPVVKRSMTVVSRLRMSAALQLRLSTPSWLAQNQLRHAQTS